MSALSKNGALRRRARPPDAANNGYGSSASRASLTRAPKEGAAGSGEPDRQLASRRVLARTRALDVPVDLNEDGHSVNSLRVLVCLLTLTHTRSHARL